MNFNERNTNFKPLTFFDFCADFGENAILLLF